MAILPPLSPVPLAEAKAPFAMKSVQQAGAEAFRTNLPTAACRFPFGSGQNLEWVRGWMAEQMRQRRIEAGEAPDAGDPAAAILVPLAPATLDATLLDPPAPAVPGPANPAGARDSTRFLD
ncbi:hypothetical protein [Aureimonas pseudogalii]|uniref:Uncharacterized protein n=1 Tax=Aureimonas pseudogalii TaxID=1744844 RepID=A0A7W6EFC3_9HYPH|nr:hypothetical protein [Aureimonas pseudogalii]MBB3997605.1 hypothetical protein [Aureimonas pseudogalii]